MTPPMTSFLADPVFLLITVLAAVTFFTRVAGWLVLARFSRIPAAVQAGLEAVPAAVITTLVVPPALNAGIAEFIAMVVAAAASFRLSPIVVILTGLGVLVALRHAGL